MKGILILESGERFYGKMLTAEPAVGEGIQYGYDGVSGNIYRSVLCRTDYYYDISAYR